jgi:FAD/FMN-containing dehydrogenase
VPDGSRSQVVLSLDRLNRIRDLDPVDVTIALEAGVPLQVAPGAAADSNLLASLFPT